MTISHAADQYSPAVIANYLYELVKNYNTFYQNVKARSHQSNNMDTNVDLEKKSDNVAPHTQASHNLNTVLHMNLESNGIDHAREHVVGQPRRL